MRNLPASKHFHPAQSLFWGAALCRVWLHASRAGRYPLGGGLLCTSALLWDAPWGWGEQMGPSKKNTNLQPSLYDGLNGHRHGAHTAAVLFVLQPVGLLREVSIRKMMNRTYTGRLFQM